MPGHGHFFVCPFSLSTLHIYLRAATLTTSSSHTALAGKYLLTPLNVVSHCARSPRRLVHYVTRRVLDHSDRRSNLLVETPAQCMPVGNSSLPPRAPKSHFVSNIPCPMTPPPPPSGSATLTADEVVEIRSSHTELHTMMAQLLEKINSLPAPSPSQVPPISTMPPVTQTTGAFVPPITAVGVNGASSAAPLCL